MNKTDIKLIELASKTGQTNQEYAQGWKDYLKTYQEKIDQRNYTSQAQVNRTMRSIINKQNSWGEKYERLIINTDSKALSLLQDSSSESAVRSILNSINGIIESIDDLKVNFSYHGQSNGHYGDSDYKKSRTILKIQGWWKKRYESIHEVAIKKANGQLTTTRRSISKAFNEKQTIEAELKDIKTKLED